METEKLAENAAADNTIAQGDAQDDGNTSNEVTISSAIWPVEFSELPQGNAQTGASITTWLNEARNQNFERWEHIDQPSEKNRPELIYIIITLSRKNSA